MRPGYSAQFQTGVVIFEHGDFPVEEEKVIETAWEYEAVREDPEDGGNIITVRFPARFDEVYTEEALRRSIRQENRIGATAAKAAGYFE